MSLTKKQKQVYDYIVEYITDNGYSPTQVEIQEYFSFKSLGSVQDYIRYLKNSGHIVSDSNSVRGLMPKSLIEQEQKDKCDELSIGIPIHGSIAAGNPIEAIEGSETIQVPIGMIGKGTHYALTVSGQSMIEDGILDGDTVIIKKAASAYNGQTVVAVIEQEATLKRFYKSKNSIELHPANSSMEPIVVHNNENFEIKGILVGLIRTY